MKRNFLQFALCGLALATMPALAHEGDAEDRAMRLHGLLLHLDRQWIEVQQTADPARRATLLTAHAQGLLHARDLLREASDRSVCVMLEQGDRAREHACIIDTEARLRATERLFGHVLNRLFLGPAAVPPPMPADGH